MKISKRLWVDKGVKWNRFIRWQVEKQHCYKARAYFICTSPHVSWLFEIVEAKQLSAHYKDCYVIGIMPTKAKALLYVKELIDAIYNTKTLEYEHLNT